MRETKVLKNKLVMSLNSPPGDIGRPWCMRHWHCTASRSHAPAVVIQIIFAPGEWSSAAGAQCCLWIISPFCQNPRDSPGRFSYPSSTSLETLINAPIIWHLSQYIKSRIVDLHVFLPHRKLILRYLFSLCITFPIRYLCITNTQL